MNIVKKFAIIMVCILTSAILQMNITQADALDDCRKIIMSNHYTIKYKNITPPTRAAMKEKQIMMDKIGFIETNPYTMYQPTSGIVTANGTTYYIETSSIMRVANVSITLSRLWKNISNKFNGTEDDKDDKEREYEYATCKLVKDDKEQFIFTRIKEQDHIKYTGHKNGKVRAIKLKKNFSASYPYDFGDAEVTRLLNAIMPNDEKIGGTVIYKRVKSGTLHGMYFVDLKAVNSGRNAIFDAIRYYFKDNKLVKIESGQYYKTAEGKLDGTRTIINITEFSNKADDQFFKLPEGLEDVTKREIEQEDGEDQK